MRLKWECFSATRNLTRVCIAYSGTVAYRIRVTKNPPRAFLHMRGGLLSDYQQIGSSFASLAEAQRLAQQIEDAR